jgi:hypothetical protein
MGKIKRGGENKDVRERKKKGKIKKIGKSIRFFLNVGNKTTFCFPI